MKRKVKTRLCSALLTLVMLISLMPTAFAASYYSGEMDASGYCELGDTDFFDSDLFNDYDYFEIVRGSGAPYVMIDDEDVEEVLLYYRELYDVYFDEGGKSYSDDYYTY